MTLPMKLQLLILGRLPFWDLYALRLTSRHFASITSPLRHPKEKYELRD